MIGIQLYHSLLIALLVRHFDFSQAADDNRTLIEYSHQMIRSSCDSDPVFYRFSLVKGTVSIDSNHNPLKISLVGNRPFQYEIQPVQEITKEFFTFTIIIQQDFELRVHVTVHNEECKDCEQCAILIPLLTCLSLLLFSALALSLMIHIKHRVSWLQKLFACFRADQNNNDSDTRSLNSIPQRAIETLQALSPRKSSLKPNRVDAFPTPPPVDEIPEPSPLAQRRKSMVTFNERTEIRI